MRYGNIDSYGDVFFSDSDVAHGMTALMPTTVYGSLSPVSGTSGGFLFQGLSDADGAGIEFHGVSGAASPTIAGVQIRGGKKDGTTWQAVAANEKVLEVFNYNTSLLTLLGNGVLNIIGDSIQINSKTITVDGALNISGDSAINQDVRTTASPTFAGGILQTQNDNIFRITAQGTGYGGDLIANLYSERTTTGTGGLLNVGSAFAPNALWVGTSGQVGICTPTPGNSLHIASDAANGQLRLSSTSPYLGHYWDIGREGTIDGRFLFINASGGAATERLSISTGGAINIAAGGILQHNGSTVLDASRNLSNIGTINGYFIGNAIGNIPVSNASVNFNLNADMVDGMHLNAFSFSNAGSYDLAGSTAAFAGIRFTSPTFTDIHLNFSTFGNDVGIIFRNSSGQQINCSGVIYYWT
jgi:hypothetical protein